MLGREAVVLLSRAAVVRVAGQHVLEAITLLKLSMWLSVPMCHVASQRCHVVLPACRFSCLVAVPSEVEKQKDPLGVVEVSAQCDHVGHWHHG